MVAPVLLLMVEVIAGGSLESLCSLRQDDVLRAVVEDGLSKVDDDQTQVESSS